MQINMHVTHHEPAMTLLYKKYAPRIFTYVRTRVPSQEDAEDIVVEVFLAAIENTRFAALPEETQHLWLWRIAHNKVIDSYRRAKNRQGVTLEHMVESLYEDDTFSPESLALRQEDYADLHTHLQSLPALQQAILQLRFGQNLPCAEIATRLGKQENAVRVALSRTLNLLRSIYHRQRGAAK